MWVVGIVERGTNRIKLFPVENRNADTFCRILERHVTPGSTIYSDGWAAYKEIGNMGYRHLFVEHKTTFFAGPMWTSKQVKWRRSTPTPSKAQTARKLHVQKSFI